MSEVIIPAKPDHRIWVLNGRQVDLIDVIAWAIPTSGHPIPITVAGRFGRNVEFVLGTESGWIALPQGQALRDSHEVRAYLEAGTRRAA